VQKRQIDAAISKAIEWGWRIRNSDKGWGDLANRPSNAMDTSELLVGLMDAGQKPSSKRVQETVEYVSQNLDNFAIRKASRNLTWPALLLMQAGLKKGHKSLDFLMKTVTDYIIEGEGWPMLRTMKRGNIYDTALVIRGLTRYGLRGHRNVQRGLDWMIKSVNRDGGWGFHRGDASDPVCTAQCILTLKELKLKPNMIKKASQYLLKTRDKDGGWPVVWEKEELYHLGKYFHYTTPWAALALHASGMGSKSVADAAAKRILRDQARNGGWKILPNYDEFTHSTGNALMFLSRV
jgi:squalene cyclase